MAESEQEFLDRALRVTSADREELSRGRVPRSVRRRQRAICRQDLGPVAISILVFVLAALVLKKPWMTLLALILGVLFALVARVREFLHERSVFATRPALCKIEGWVETRRTWNYSYGDTYELWSTLEFSEAKADPYRDTHTIETFAMFEALGNHIVSGRARLYVVVVPKLPSFYVAVAAIEISDHTHILEKPPAKPPPDEPYRGGVPAD